MNLTNYPWPIPKYQPTVEPLPQYPSTWLTPATWTDVVGCKVLHFVNNEDMEALSYKTIWCTNTVIWQRENKSLGLYILVWQPLK